MIHPLVLGWNVVLFWLWGMAIKSLLERSEAGWQIQQLEKLAVTLNGKGELGSSESLLE